MTDVWAKWEGLVIDGAFPLRRFLGRSNHSVVFLTEHRGRNLPDAAIKFVPADPVRGEAQLASWRTGAALSHPHLIRLFDVGRCQLGGHNFIFLVMEFADQTLDQLLVHRALTADEVREVLPPALDALAFLHRKRLVHGQLKPPNILVVNDQLKLASDTVRPAGASRVSVAKSSLYDPPEAKDGRMFGAGDVWALGITLVEALTLRDPVWPDEAPDTASLPATLPPAFVDTVRRCLSRNPANRPTISSLAAQFERTPATPVEPPREPAVRPRPVSEADEAVRAQPVAEFDQAVRSQPAAAPDEAMRARPVAELDEATRPQPIAEPDEAMGPRPVVEADEAERPQPVTELGQAVRPQPFVEPDETIRPQPAVAADEVVRTQPVSESDQAPRHQRIADLDQATRAPPVTVAEPDGAAQPRPAVPHEAGREVRSQLPLVQWATRERLSFATAGGIVVLVVVWAGFRLLHNPVTPQQPAPAASAMPVPPAALPAPAGGSSTAPPKATASNSSPLAVLHEEIPQPSRSARQSIRGRISVTIRVVVDRSGTVIQVSPEHAGPSRYFARLSLDASKKWKFARADSQQSRVWLVRFEFTRSGTTGRAVPRP